MSTGARSISPPASPATPAQGQVVVEEGAIVALPKGTARFEPLGRVELKGIPDPVGLWLATVAPAPA